MLKMQPKQRKKNKKKKLRNVMKKKLQRTLLKKRNKLRLKQNLLILRPRKRRLKRIERLLKLN